ncbi:hypothetical protein Y032_0016g2940 [Ancylostoma ceylanicum]|uniref:Uncharacterized protein n=1 Tax=Ancylostoma ceylanicum TaxID=53326 RepID=A0A016V6Y1_9BILA|nr:hypothetical protein Y032_0016g2940 [Ancylostoma ceylanicum]
MCLGEGGKKQNNPLGLPCLLHLLVVAVALVLCADYTSTLLKIDKNEEAKRNRTLRFRESFLGRLAIAHIFHYNSRNFSTRLKKNFAAPQLLHPLNKSKLQ